MSDIMEHSRPDIDYMPSDCEPISISPYLLKPCRTVQQAARDILRRQLEEQSLVVVDLASERAKRRKW